MTPKLHIRLDIDPSEASSYDDTFTLFSTDGQSSYSKTLTVCDDARKGDTYVDLIFEDLDKTLAYTLEVDEGKERYTVFEDVPFDYLPTVSPQVSKDSENTEENVDTQNQADAGNESSGGATDNAEADSTGGNQAEAGDADATVNEVEYIPDA